MQEPVTFATATHCVQDQHQVTASMVAPHWAEVAVPCLAEGLPAVADHQVLLAAAAHVSNRLPELAEREGAVAVQRHVGAVALGKASGLLDSSEACNTTQPFVS